MQSQSESPPSVAPGLEPQQRSELRFDDGNVVIVAGNAAFRVRVHTGILSRHSEIFHNMFGVPQPGALPAPPDIFDGQPVVHVPDSAHDFKAQAAAGHTLQGRQVHAPKLSEPVNFPVLAALTRLGHKYHCQIEWVLKEAMRRPQSIFKFAHGTYDSEDWLN